MASSTRMTTWLKNGLQKKNVAMKEFISLSQEEQSSLLSDIIGRIVSRHGGKKLKRKSFQNIFTDLKKSHKIDIVKNPSFKKAKMAYIAHRTSTTLVKSETGKN